VKERHSLFQHVLREEEEEGGDEEALETTGFFCLVNDTIPISPGVRSAADGTLLQSFLATVSLDAFVFDSCYFCSVYTVIKESRKP
jgi:hypothetical protein